MSENFDYNNLRIHPTLEPIRMLFEFFILGTGFVGQFDFQKVFLQAHPELTGLVERYNKEVNLRKEGKSVKSETGPYWVLIGRVMVISLFNILEFSQSNNDINQAEFYKFAKHVRNGAAHNNRFNINPPVQEAVRWRDKTIDNSLNGSTVFPDFMNPTLLIILASDISRLIDEVEKNARCKIISKGDGFSS